MKIALDFTYGVGATSGIGRYANRLARALASTTTPDDSFSLFFIDFLRKFDANAACPECASNPQFAFCPARLLPARAYERLWNIPFVREAFSIVPHGTDLCHITSHAAIPVRKRQKMVCTIHDMAAWRFPHGSVMAKDRRAITLNARHADVIIADSAFGASEIASILPDCAQRINVVPLGIDHDVFKPIPPKDIATMRNALGLKRPYILSVGLIHPTKNHAFLGKVLDSLGNANIELVISGAPSIDFDTIRKEMAALRCADRIRFLGRIDDMWLPALYSGAEIYLTASRSEGFGFTPLEAMACGTPVVSSSAGSLPEVLGDAAAVLGSEDIGLWREAVHRLLSDSLFREAMRERGIANAARYSWDKTARKTIEIYRAVLN